MTFHRAVAAIAVFAAAAFATQRALAEFAPRGVPTQLPNKVPARRASLDAGRVTKINYGYTKWNLDANKVDLASLILREGKTGRLVQISLQETGQDSAVFSGDYSLNWRALEELAPEFYIPPQELLSTSQGVTRIAEMIANGQLARRPFILRKAPGTGMQYIEIYDTREQARAALSAFRAEKLAADPSVAKQQVERVRLEQVISSGALERLAAFKELDEASRANRKESAKKAADAALVFYRAQRYKEARHSFMEALELDPESHNFDFPMGVTLYKLDEVDRAIVYLERASGPAVEPSERSYFLALAHFRLRELLTAFDLFGQSRRSANTDIQSSSCFYQGVIRFEEQSLKNAQALFQEVLDRSQDAKLSKRADAYIDQITRMQQFATERSKPWAIAMNVGEIYDSNVTLAATSAQNQGTATNVAGNRSLFQTTLKYRPLYEVDREFAAQVDLLWLYTVDQSLQFNQNLKNADPFIAALSASWTHKGELWGLVHKLDLVPGVESTRMSVDKNVDKEILNSILFSAYNTFVMSDRWFTTANLEMRKDNSELTTSVGAEDSSALKGKLSWGNVVYLSKDKNRVGANTLAYSNNQANGTNAKYDRFDMSAAYIGLLPHDLAYNLGLSYFYLSYPQHVSARTDNNYAASAGLSQKLSDSFSSSFSLNYAANDSNNDINVYRKWTAMVTISSNLRF